jgi:hypothetical protein
MRAKIREKSLAITKSNFKGCHCHHMASNCHRLEARYRSNLRHLALL